MIANEELRKLGDRRKLKRFSDRLKISFAVNGITYRGLVTNFSLTGLFIRTNRSFPTGIDLDISIHLSKHLTSHLKGKIVRSSNEPLLGVSRNAKEYAEKGVGIELIEEDDLYLHFIRSFLSADGKNIFRQLALTEQEGKYLEIEAELQKKCHLFDTVAVVIGKQSKQAGVEGKAWFEAKIKNNTNYVFVQPIVTFMTTKHNEDTENGKGNRPLEISVMLMSASDDLSHWKPGETITLDGEIDPSSENIPIYELAFFDYLTKMPEFAVDFPMRINDHVSTLWAGSPCLAGIDENIPDDMPFELLQPSLSADKTMSRIEDSATSDSTASNNVLLPSSSGPVVRYGLSRDNFQRDETDEALNDVKISYPPAIGLNYGGEDSSQDWNNSESFGRDRPSTQKTNDTIFKAGKSMTPIRKWFIAFSSVIMVSIFVSVISTDNRHRPSFNRQSLVTSSSKIIATGTEREEMAGKQQSDRQERVDSAERNAPDKNRRNTNLLKATAIRRTSTNKRLNNINSSRRSRQDLSTKGVYLRQIGRTVYKKGQGTVTDIWGGVLIDCGSLCSTFVDRVLYLKATPDAGSVFIQWLGCDSVDTNKVCKVNMVSEDKEITAIFK